MSSVRRVIAVVDLLSREGAMGVRAIAQALQLPVGSLHRLLQDLAEDDVIARTTNGEWELSHRLVGIVGRHLDRLEFPQIARPFCELMAREFGESVSVTGLSDFKGICLDKVRGGAGMKLDASVGFRAPLHCGGGGKALLAWLPKQDQARLLERELEALTQNSITDPKRLIAEIATIQRQGYAIDAGEVVTGVHCVGAPILNRSGFAVGAISISGSEPKVPGERLDRMVTALNEACQYTSARMGYGGAWPPTTAQEAATAADGPAPAPQART